MLRVLFALLVTLFIGAALAQSRIDASTEATFNTEPTSLKGSAANIEGLEWTWTARRSD
jgi:hypothetical protein